MLRVQLVTVSWLVAAAASVDFGLNLPTMTGTSGTGAFLPGVYNFSFPKQQLSHAKQRGFTSFRLPVNVPTANSPATLAQMRALVSGIGGSAIICMFGTGNLTTHGTGRIDSLRDTIVAWAKVHAVFEGFPHVKYEIFNEPHGYNAWCNSPPCGTPASYYSDMQAVIAGAKLPQDRCILDSLGWAEDAQGLAKLGWPGAIGYHFYPWWLAGQNNTKAEYKALLKSQIAGLSDRTYITEFGGNLNVPNLNYEQPSTTSNDVNCLQGIDEALTELRAAGVGVKGAFHWHGWANGDSFSFWDPRNVNGSAKILRILQDM
jgi:hypothetical protein